MRASRRLGGELLKRQRIIAFTLGMVATFTAGFSCRDATQARVGLRTNVPFAPGMAVALWAGPSATGPALSRTEAAWSDNGTIGDIVVTPAQQRDEALTVRVTMGIGRAPEECPEAGGSGCVVARRKLRFVPHTALRIPIVMYQACIGVRCEGDTTCSASGACVSANVDPNTCQTESGCTLPGDDVAPAVDAGADTAPSLDSGSETAADATTDAGRPVVAVGPQDGLIITAGQQMTCVIIGSGVKCWGNGFSSALGVGDLNARGDGPGEMGPNLSFANAGTGAIEIASGVEFTCARTAQGQVKCWGKNSNGQLGAAAAGTFLDLGGEPAKAVSAGDAHACALTDTGRVFCWGRNHAGQLGLGDVAPRATPFAVPLGEPAVDVGAGHGNTCVVLASGKIKCWGESNRGQNGLGTTDTLLAPGDAVDLGPNYAARQIAAAQYAACALLDTGTVKCWGDNSFGQLGVGDAVDRGIAPGQMGTSLPEIKFGTSARPVALVGGDDAVFCARFDDGALKCWGANTVGQLGLGDTLTRQAVTPDTWPFVALGGKALAVAVGGGHLCARVDNGDTRCWGANGFGELGQGNVTPLSSPSPPLQLQ
jgi:alpha-tubulin suppressor-like RCC1 family protein